MKANALVGTIEGSLSSIALKLENGLPLRVAGAGGRPLAFEGTKARRAVIEKFNEFTRELVDQDWGITGIDGPSQYL